jgi:hypothetical protein
MDRPEAFGDSSEVDHLRKCRRSDDYYRNAWLVVERYFKAVSRANGCSWQDDGPLDFDAAEIDMLIDIWASTCADSMFFDCDMGIHLVASDRDQD